MKLRNDLTRFIHEQVMSAQASLVDYEIRLRNDSVSGVPSSLGSLAVVATRRCVLGTFERIEELLTPEDQLSALFVAREATQGHSVVGGAEE